MLATRTRADYLITRLYLTRCSSARSSSLIRAGSGKFGVRLGALSLPLTSLSPSSSLLFSFATLIIHSCFQTSRTDPTINEASSYLDLSPLYGNNDAEIATVRSFRNGELYPDVAASDRLQFMPPSVMALLLVFNRNHNFIAEKLLAINERGRFVPWTDSPKDDAEAKAIAATDEEVFQTARLVSDSALHSRKLNITDPLSCNRSMRVSS